MLSFPPVGNPSDLFGILPKKDSGQARMTGNVTLLISFTIVKL
jgi:hypothetical protein